jgi:hypothetical protein
MIDRFVEQDVCMTSAETVTFAFNIEQVLNCV